MAYKSMKHSKKGGTTTDSKKEDIDVTKNHENLIFKCSTANAIFDNKAASGTPYPAIQQAEPDAEGKPEHRYQNA